MSTAPLIQAIFLLFLLTASSVTEAQSKYPIVELRHGKVFLETGKLQLLSVKIYEPNGTVAAEKIFEKSRNPELPAVFNKAGEYILVFQLRRSRTIVRKLIVL